MIPGALAGILLGMRVPGAEIIASITFLAILITILLQAITTRWLAAKLELLEEHKILAAIPATNVPSTVALAYNRHMEGQKDLDLQENN